MSPTYEAQGLSSALTWWKTPQNEGFPNISFVAQQIGGIPLTIDIPMFHIENECIFDITKTLTSL